VAHAHGAAGPALHPQLHAARRLPRGLRPRWVRQVHGQGHAALGARRLAAGRDPEAAVDEYQAAPRGGGEGPERGGRERVDVVGEVGGEAVGDKGDGRERGVREAELVLEAPDGSALEGDDEVYGLRRRGRVLLEPAEERGYRTDHGLAAEAAGGVGGGGCHCHCWRALAAAAEGVWEL